MLCTISVIPGGSFLRCRLGHNLVCLSLYSWEGLFLPCVLTLILRTIRVFLASTFFYDPLRGMDGSPSCMYIEK
jgi:hypothetical protein